MAPVFGLTAAGDNAQGTGRRGRCDPARTSQPRVMDYLDYPWVVLQEGGRIPLLALGESASCPQQVRRSSGQSGWVRSRTATIAAPLADGADPSPAASPASKDRPGITCPLRPPPPG